jgi:hypothetical protein
VPARVRTGATTRCFNVDAQMAEQNSDPHTVGLVAFSVVNKAATTEGK